MVRSRTRERIERNALLTESKAPHLNEVLRDFRHPLLAFVDREVRPVDELLVNLSARPLDAARTRERKGGEGYLLECLGVVIRELDALPHVRGRVRTLDGLHVEVEDT